MNFFPQKSLKASLSSRDGFTLMELLAVVGTILVLAALLFPAGKSMIDKSNQSKCTSNLRQLYLAVRAYGQDNNDRIIYSQGSRGKIKSKDWAPELAYNGYLREEIPPATGTNTKDEVGKIPVFRCPAAIANRRNNASADTQYTYGFNYHLSSAPDDESTVPPKTFSKLSRPSGTMIISEGNGTVGWYLNTSKLPNAEHGDKANLLFCDGHVEMRDPQKFPARTTPEGKLFWEGVEG